MEKLEVRDAGDAPKQDVEMFQGEIENEIPSGEIPQDTPQEAAPITETEGNGVDPKDDQSRYEYWQSQADKAKSELSGLREEREYYKNGLQPVEQMIRQNPEVLQSLETKLSNGQPVGQTQN